MVKKYSQLKTAATFERDREFQQKALNAWSEVRKYLEQVIEYVQLHGELPTNFVRVPNRDGFGTSAKTISPQIVENIPLYFIFSPDNQGFEGGLGWTSGEKQAVIILTNLIRPFDLTHADTRLLRNTFVHEYIHYLDACRKKGLGNRLNYRNSPPDLDNQVSTEEYFNRPAEMNAFYQETAHIFPEVVSRLKEMKEQGYDYYDKHMKDFPTFLNFALPFFREDWIENISEKKMRNIKKRLYNLYIKIKG